LLSDTGSAVIKKYGLLNMQIKPGEKNHGIPNPGLFIVDGDLRVVDKQFHQSYAERPTAENVLVSYFDKANSVYVREFKTPYLTGRIAISDTLVHPAQIVAVAIRMRLRDNFHIYGTPVPTGYVPLTITIPGTSDFSLDTPVYPATREIVLESLNETFHILPARLDLRSFVRVAKNARSGEHSLSLQVEFQACDDKTCMMPQALTLQFPVTITRSL
jgi:hypothetical protein